MRISVWSSDVCSSDLMQLSRICIWKPHQRMEGLFTVQSGVSSFRKYKQGRVLAVSLLASVAAAGVWIPQAAQAQTGGEAGVREFNIPPRALSAALADFGRQSGMQVNVDADALRRRSSDPKSGAQGQGVSDREDLAVHLNE